MNNSSQLCLLYRILHEFTQCWLSPTVPGESTFHIWSVATSHTGAVNVKNDWPAGVLVRGSLRDSVGHSKWEYGGTYGKTQEGGRKVQKERRRGLLWILLCCFKMQNSILLFCTKTHSLYLTNRSWPVLKIKFPFVGWVTGTRLSMNLGVFCQNKLISIPVRSAKDLNFLFNSSSPKVEICWK